MALLTLFFIICVGVSAPLWIPPDQLALLTLLGLVFGAVHALVSMKWPSTKPVEKFGYEKTKDRIEGKIYFPPSEAASSKFQLLALSGFIAAASTIWILLYNFNTMPWHFVASIYFFCAAAIGGGIIFLIKFGKLVSS